MDVVDMTLQIGFVANRMLPEPSLPDAPLAARNTHIGTVFDRRKASRI